MKNRDYTGLERTPSSMAWLIRKRSVLHRQIDQIERQLKEGLALIQALKATVAALDLVIPMHAVAVDPPAIKGRRRQTKAILPHGVITRGILDALKRPMVHP